MSSSSSTSYTTSSPIFRRQNVPNANPAGFAPSASPPLILAFLAIGLFGLSMIGVFGWRRIQYARIRGEIPGRELGADERPSRTGIGPKPKLWDLWTIDTKDSNKRSIHDFDMTTEHETWDTIMPISAVVTPPYPTKSDGTTSQVPESTAVPFYRWTRHIEPTATATEKGRGKVKDNNGNEERRIQLAVAIAMPSQPIPHDVTRNMRIGKGSMEEAGSGDAFAYTLGVYECAWGHDNG